MPYGATNAPARAKGAEAMRSRRRHAAWLAALCLAATWRVGLGAAEQAEADRLLAQLRSDDHSKVLAAIDGLRHVGDQRTGELVRLALTHYNGNVRRRAAWSVALLEDRDAVARLIAGLDAQDAVTREHAAEALGVAGPLSREAVAALARTLGHAEGDMRRWAARELEQVGPPAASAVPALAKALRGDHRFVRNRAALALAAIGPGAQPAVPDLVEALADDDHHVVANAATALGNIGPPAAKATLPLLRSIQDPLRYGCNQKLWALLQIAPPPAEAVEALAEALRGEHNLLPWTAARCLGTMGDRARPAVAALALTLKHKTAYVREEAAAALGRIGPAANRAIPALEEARATGDPRLSEAARRALARIRQAEGATEPIVGKDWEDEEVQGMYRRWKAAEQAALRRQRFRDLLAAARTPQPLKSEWGELTPWERREIAVVTVSKWLSRPGVQRHFRAADDGFPFLGATIDGFRVSSGLARGRTSAYYVASLTHLLGIRSSESVEFIVWPGQGKIRGLLSHSTRNADGDTRRFFDHRPCVPWPPPPNPAN